MITYRINPGELRHRVTFYGPSVAKSATTGADVVTFDQAVCTVWAEMNPGGGNKFWDGARFNWQGYETVVIRYRAEIAPNLQMEYAGRRFEILSMSDVEERRVKLILALRELK